MRLEGGVGKFMMPNATILAYVDARGHVVVGGGGETFPSPLAYADARGHVYEYNPQQPRAAKGSQEGGQWTSVTAYHGTASEAVEQIRKRGLLPRTEDYERNWDDLFFKGERGKSVFITTSFANAAGYAEQTSMWAGRGKPVVLELEVPAVEWKSFRKDMRTNPKFSYYRVGGIPPQWIKGAVELTHAGETRKLFEEETSVAGKILHLWSVFFLMEPPQRGEVVEKPLYVCRPVLNAAAIIEWAKGAGFETTLPPDEMHVTVAYSKRPMNWNAVAEDTSTIKVERGRRTVEPLGDGGAVVLKFDSAELQRRHYELRDVGASWDYDEYHPHLTLSYTGAPDVLPPPYTRTIILGPERFEEIEEDWHKGVEEMEQDDGGQEEDKEHKQQKKEPNRFVWGDEDLVVVVETPDDGEKTKEHAEKEEGVWRTINGRRVFLRKGETPAEVITRDKLQQARETLGGGGASDTLQSVFDYSGVEFTQDEVGALNDYVRTAYGEINRVLRGDPAAVKGGQIIFKPAIARLDAMIEKAPPVPVDMTVSRAIKVTTARRLGVAAGMVLQDKGFVSTTLSKAVANDFHGQPVMVFDIKVVKGSKALSVPSVPGLMTLSAGVEAEVLLPRGAQFRVTKIKGNVVEAELLQTREHVLLHAYSQVDYAQIKLALDTLETTALDTLKPLLTEQRNLLIAAVRRRADDLHPLARSLKLPRMGALRDAVREMVQEAMEQGQRDAKREVKEARKGNYAEWDESRHPRQPEETEVHDYTFTAKGAVSWLITKVFWITDLLSDGITADARGLLINAIRNGEAISETVARLWDLFEPFIGDPDVLEDGEPLGPHRLETIVRTNQTDAYNHGRLSEYVRPDMLPFLQGLRYSAVLDNRTTPVCRFLHERIFPDPENAMVPPLHFNCRSILVPVVVGEKVDEKDFITPVQVGKAEGLADAKFLSQEENELTQGEKDYAQEQGCVWRTIRGRRVCIREGETPTEAVRRDIEEQEKGEKEKETAGSEEKHSLALREQLARYEVKRNFKAKTEYGWAFTTDGKKIISKAGGASSIQWLESEARKMKDGVTTHNHPTGDPLSLSDAVFAATYDVREMRAFGTANGQSFIYSLVRPAKGWPKPEDLKFSLDTSLRRRGAIEAYRIGKMNEAQAGEELHKSMEEMAGKFGIGYSRKKVAI